MVTDTKSATGRSTAFDEYVARLGPRAHRIPEELEEGAPVPPSWTGSPEEWEKVRRRAVDAFKEKPAYDFAFAIAVRGYFPDELATGQLRPGAEVNVATGAVVRPLEPTIPLATEDRAREALRAMAGRNLKLDPVLQQNLELAAHGSYTSQPRGAEAAITAAESSVRQYEAQRQRAVAEEQARPVLTVRFRFRAVAGKTYAPGTYRIDPPQADQLREWQEKMEAQARQHDWDYPIGFKQTSWPPFEINEPSP